MNKLQTGELNYISFKKIKSKKYDPILIEDSYQMSKTARTTKKFQLDRENFNYVQRNLHQVKNSQVKNHQLEKGFKFSETSRSMISHSKETSFHQGQRQKMKYELKNIKRPSHLLESSNHNPETNYLKKINDQRKNLPFYNFLQMAKKQKQKPHPTFTLMFNPKIQINRPKTELSIIQELRETEDTIPDRINFEMNHSPKPSDFHQVRLLGKGKNGQVYLAIHKYTGFACAMKIIKKKDINRGSFMEKQKIQDQLLQQIKIQMYLSHPNLIELYCVFSDKENVYLIQQLGINGQLYELMRKRNKFSQQATALISRQILQGIKAMHEKNIIHRDLKPENIVLVYGICKICDFGWSIHCSLEIRSTLCGTPLYLSPEILTGGDYNQKIDIWAFGTLVYELFTGQTPFKVKQKSDLQKIVTEELFFENNFPQKLKDFLFFILKKNFSQRPTASEILKHKFLQKYAELETSEQLSTT